MSYFDNEGHWMIFQALYLCDIDDWVVRKRLDPTQRQLKFYTWLIDLINTNFYCVVGSYKLLTWTGEVEALTI